MSAFSRISGNSNSTNSAYATQSSDASLSASSAHPNPTSNDNRLRTSGEFAGSNDFELSSSLSSPPKVVNGTDFLRNQHLNRQMMDTSSMSGSLKDANRSNSNNNVVYSDRFIPSRNATNLESAFDNLELHVQHSQNIGNGMDTITDGSSNNNSSGGSLGRPSHISNEYARENLGMMNNLLRSELLGHNTIPAGSSSGMMGGTLNTANNEGSIYSMSSLDGSAGGGLNNLRSSGEFSRSSTGSNDHMMGLGAGGPGGSTSFSAFTGQKMLRFKSDRRRSGGGDSVSLGSNQSTNSSESTSNNSYGTSSFGNIGGVPGSPSNFSRLSGTSPKKPTRKISKTPFKILDAPSLQDDYYLNLVDWSSANMLSVALGSNVYLWSAYTSKVTKLCDTGSDNAVTSICWSPTGSHLAVGCNNGKIQIWDVQENKLVRDMADHCNRVGTMAWSSTLLATGSRDRNIYLQDGRVRGTSSSSGGQSTVVGSSNPGDPCIIHELTSHKQEVCGLKWSPDERMLASGGNDNKLYVWAANHAEPSNPLCKFTDHSAAVKAVAWSPHQSGLLASGGGTADRHIRFWNALNGK